MTREEMINALVGAALDNGDMDEVLSDYEDCLRSGRRGYNDMTDEEVKELYGEYLEE